MDRTAERIARDVDVYFSLGIPERHARCHPPLRIASCCFCKTFVRKGQRFKGDDSPRISMRTQVDPVVSGVGTDIQDEIDTAMFDQALKLGASGGVDRVPVCLHTQLSEQNSETVLHQIEPVPTRTQKRDQSITFTPQLRFGQTARWQTGRAAPVYRMRGAMRIAVTPASDGKQRDASA